MPNKEQYGAIRKIMRNEITILIAAIVGVFSFVMFVVAPQYRTEAKIGLIQQSISTIQSNHLTHLQGYAEEIVQIKKDCSDRQGQYLIDKSKNDKEHTDLIRNIERILVTIELSNKN